MNERSDMSGYRVLVVDDNCAIHEDFRKILGSRAPASQLLDFEASVFGSVEDADDVDLGYDLSFARQGEEALRNVCNAVNENRRFSLAFVDMRMPPGWDGLETIEHLWQADADIHAVVCTAYSDYSWPEMAKRLTRRAQWLALKKPFDHVEVLQAAAALTQQWEEKRQARERIKSLEEVVTRQQAALRAGTDNGAHAAELSRNSTLAVPATVDSFAEIHSPAT